jgi:hypothetical protein
LGTALRHTVATARVWRTVKLGKHPLPALYRSAIIDSKMRIGDWANEMLLKLSIAAEELEVPLVNLSVEQLGFERGACTMDLYAQALLIGLQLCAPEVGPALRLQYSQQPRDEQICVAMEAIGASDGLPVIFVVESDRTGLWLFGCRARPGTLWSAADRFVFARKRNELSPGHIQ